MIEHAGKAADVGVQDHQTGFVPPRTVQDGVDFAIIKWDFQPPPLPALPVVHRSGRPQYNLYHVAENLTGIGLGRCGVIDGSGNRPRRRRPARLGLACPQQRRQQGDSGQQSPGGRGR
ncbi:MAG: hypothetical protein WBF55_16090 [Syntrophobacteria bacterium]